VIKVKQSINFGFSISVYQGLKGSFNTEWMSSHSSKVEKQNYKFGSSRFHAMSLASKKRIDVPIYPVSIEGEKILANNLENLIT
jgi:hypothetical protein